MNGVCSSDPVGGVGQRLEDALCLVAAHAHRRAHAARSGEPPPMTCTVLRVEPPVLFEVDVRAGDERDDVCVGEVGGVDLFALCQRLRPGQNRRIELIVGAQNAKAPGARKSRSFNEPPGPRGLGGGAGGARLEIASAGQQRVVAWRQTQGRDENRERGRDAGQDERLHHELRRAIERADTMDSQVLHEPLAVQ